MCECKLGEGRSPPRNLANPPKPMSWLGCQVPPNVGNKNPKMLLDQNWWAFQITNLLSTTPTAKKWAAYRHFQGCIPLPLVSWAIAKLKCPYNQNIRMDRGNKLI